VIRFVLSGKPVVLSGLDGAWPASGAGVIRRITLWRGTAGSSGQVIVDVNKAGTTIYSTQGNRPTVTAASGNDAISTTTPDILTFNQDDLFEIDIDEVDAGNPLDLSVTITVEFT